MMSVPDPSVLMVWSALSATISSFGNPPSGVGIAVAVAVRAGVDVAGRIGVDVMGVAVDARVCAGAQDVRTRAKTIGSSLIVLILISILWWFKFSVSWKIPLRWIFPRMHLLRSLQGPVRFLLAD